MWIHAGSFSGFVYEMIIDTGRKYYKYICQTRAWRKCYCKSNQEIQTAELQWTISSCRYNWHSLCILNGIWCIGTFGAEKSLCVATCDKIKKGDIEKPQAHDQRLHFVKWMDTRAVRVLSNFECAEGTYRSR